MLIGYARVSTNEQENAAQVEALKAVGCERIYREKASGGRWDRPELHRLLDQFRKGDVLVVWKLDRKGHAARTNEGNVSGTPMPMHSESRLFAPWRSVETTIIDTIAAGKVHCFRTAIIFALDPLYQFVIVEFTL